MSFYDVPEYSQKTANLCWEACARMMWYWKHETLSGYKDRAGAYATANKGLTHDEMNKLYKHLGMHSLPRAKGKNLRFALRWTPVIFTGINKAVGHAMVAAGHAGKTYTVVNPCGVEVVNFESDTTICSTAAKISLKEADVDRSLGDYIWYWTTP